VAFRSYHVGNYTYSAIQCRSHRQLISGCDTRVNRNKRRVSQCVIQQRPGKPNEYAYTLQVTTHLANVYRRYIDDQLHTDRRCHIDDGYRIEQLLRFIRDILHFGMVVGSQWAPWGSRLPARHYAIYIWWPKKVRYHQFFKKSH